MVKRFILNADDFGMSKAINRAVSEAYESGLLKSVSLTPNGEAFDEAVDAILPKCSELGVGIHLNITKGKSLCTDINLLTDSNMNFCRSYLSLLMNAYNPQKKDFLPQIEREFRRQIEKVLAKTKVTHIDSHNHIHSIPPIFDMVCRLAKEYKIPQVRTHFEKFYFIPEPLRYLNKTFILNLFRKFLLNFLTLFNQNTVSKYELKTNDYIIGTGFASAMDSIVIAYGMQAVREKNVTVEAFIHPCRYEEGTIDNYFDEYMIAKNKKLTDIILSSGYDITNYKEISEEVQEEVQEKTDT